MDKLIKVIKRHPSLVCATAIWLVGFGVLLRFALFAFVIESDAFMEYQIYLKIIETGQLDLGIDNLLASALFTTLLPALVQKLSGVDAELLFRIYTCFIVPFVPVTVYFIAKRYVGGVYALIASLFISSQILFLVAPQAARVSVGTLFFALIVLTILQEQVTGKKRIALLTVLSTCLVLTHYTEAYLALFVLGLAWLISQVIQWIRKAKFANKPALLVAVVAIVVSALIWNGLIVTAPWQYGFRLARDVFSPKPYTLTVPAEEVVPGTPIVPSAVPRAVPRSALPFIPPDMLEEVEDEVITFGFWDLEIRDPVIQVAFGKTLPYMNTPQRIEFVFSWLVIILLSFGTLMAIRRKYLDNGCKALGTACFITVLLAVALPQLSTYIGIGRIFYQMLAVLAVCFVIGGIEVAHKIRVKPLIVLLVITIPYAMCTSGLMHLLFGYSRGL